MNNRKHTVESKKKISDARRKFLKENPEKHPWRSKDKFQLQVSYISEYRPNIDNRFFSIDIALPDKKIALEINGNQHYEKDGSLKPYYKERHDLMVLNGWKVFEIHYSACFNLDEWADFVKIIEDSPKIEIFDYFTYTPKELYTNYDLCQCGNKKAKTSKNCLKCSKITKKNNFPSKEELEKYVNKIPATHISKIFGVSDTTIRKWCIFYKIERQNIRGFWTKFGKHEET